MLGRSDRLKIWSVTLKIIAIIAQQAPIISMSNLPNTIRPQRSIIYEPPLSSGNEVRTKIVYTLKTIFFNETYSSPSRFH